MHFLMVEAHAGYFPQAARLLLGPQQARRAAEMLHKYIDDMWHLCGDRSMDLSWYTKRAALGGILSAAQLYMVTDFSPNFTDTWKLIDKRVEVSYPFYHQHSFWGILVQSGDKSVDFPLLQA